jgi:hypothetical protein
MGAMGSYGGCGGALAAWRGEACEAPSEAKPVRWRPRRGNAQILLNIQNVFKHINVEGLCYKLVHAGIKGLFLDAVIA